MQQFPIFKRGEYESYLRLGNFWIIWSPKRMWKFEIGGMSRLDVILYNLRVRWFRY